MQPSVHALRPLAIMVAVFGLLEILGLDRGISHTLFYEPASGQWLGGGSGSWWARDLLHHTGRWLVRGVAAGALLAWVVSLVTPRRRHWRRDAGFVFIAIALPVAVVGALKAVTNVDCPWDLAEFGGIQPYVGLFAARPDHLPGARCFPGAHSASGFALLCFYFLWRDRRPRLARGALWTGGGIGLLFALGQEARGAHFVSHDLASAILVWSMQWAIYARWRANVHPAQQDELQVEEVAHERAGAPQHSQASRMRASE